MITHRKSNDTLALLRLPAERLLVGIAGYLVIVGSAYAANPYSMPTADTGTVQYFVQHPDERKAAIADCRSKAVNTFGESAESKRCRAAVKAAEEVFYKRMDKPDPRQYKGF